MNLSRIGSLIDVERMQRSCVTVIGTGGGANLCRNLIRCGLGHIRLVDFDKVELVNVCRQEHMHDAIGMHKVEALSAELRRINPQVQVQCFPRDFCNFTDGEIDIEFGDSDLFVFAVDNLAANARGNATALRLGKPAVWSGVYPAGRAGEVAFWQPGIKSCYRCMTGPRFKAHEAGEVNGSTESADVLAVQYIDSITGMLALGLLTQGADNIYGRLIAKLGQRNFLQIKIDPDYAWNGRDVFREQLQVPASCEAYFSFLTIARRDPDDGEPPCPDCVQYLGRRAAA